MKRAEVKKLDALVSRKVRDRVGGCEFCHLDEGIFHVHHMISRSYRGTRWDPDNLVKICRGCHFKAHHHPLWNDRMAEERLGEREWKNLKLKAEAVHKLDYKLVKLLWEGM